MEEELVGPTKPVQNIKRLAGEIIENNGLSLEWSVVVTYLNDKTLNKKIQNAVVAYVHAHLLQEKMQKSKDVRNAVYNALLLMEAAENLNILEWAPDINRGIKVNTGAKNAHEALYGTLEEKEERWAQYQADVDELYKDKKGIKSYRQLCIWVAKKHDVSYKTIQRNTKNPFKK